MIYFARNQRFFTCVLLLLRCWLLEAATALGVGDSVGVRRGTGCDECCSCSTTSCEESCTQHRRRDARSSGARPPVCTM